MQAQQKALETSAHNIANANTPGFTRQRGVMATTPPWPVPSLNSSNIVGQVGTGVGIVRIERVRDEFLDVQRRKEITIQGQWSIRRDTLEQIEVIFQEPTENGLNSLLAQFWDSWQELSKRPESSAVRTTVKETAIALADALNHTYQQLEDLSQDLDSIIKIKVMDINSIATQIDRLNKQIKAARGAGFEPNDLYDQRDKLLDELAKIIDFRTEQFKDGTINVYLFNESSGDYTNRLVDGEEGHTNTLAVDNSGGTLVVEWASYTSAEPSGSAPNPGDDLGVSDDTTQRTISGGELKGLFDARDQLLSEYMDDLNSLAAGIINEINAVHRNGFDLNGNAGGDFFTGTGARDIALAGNIEANVSAIAAASYSPTVPGDGTNALKIAKLKSTNLYYDEATKELRSPVPPEVGNTTFDDFYRNLIARLGVDTHESERMVENQEALVEQLEKRKEGISGVSIDEELAHMIEYQRAYQAAARFLSTMDELLDTLINRMAW